jgi:carbamoyltransferase
MPTVSTAQPWILGLGASHNGGACLLHGDRIVCAIQEERLSRIKRHRTFGAEPGLAIRYCLDAGGITTRDLDLVVISVQGDARGPRHDPGLNPQLQLHRHDIPVLTVSHHLAHAASAFGTSGADEAGILIVDGLGSPHDDLSAAERAAADRADGYETLSLYRASKAGIEPLEKHLVADGAWLTKRAEGMPLFGSLGGMYSAVSQQIFGDPMEAGKVMGLAPYGTPRFPREEFWTLDGRGHFIFHDTISARFPHHRRWPDLGEIYADLACSVQAALEAAVLAVVERMRQKVSAPCLCYSGGVALNCPLNERLVRESGFERVHIFPAAEDSGTAVGAAFLGLHHLTGAWGGASRYRRDTHGRTYTRLEIAAATTSAPVMSSDVEDRCAIEETARRLASGQFAGWFDGGSELGPRALGQRSILADPRRAEAKSELNRRIKHREDFRPFAPLILAEHVHEWFEVGDADPDSPFMLRVWRFRPEARDRVPAVVHKDGTGRVQTVRPEDHPRLYALISRFRAITGVPMLLNTSFNGAGEPIVETPEDAIWCLLENGLDFLAFQGSLVERQPAVSSLLDLVPRLAATHYRVAVPLDDHKWSNAVPSAGTLDFHVDTPWGTQTRYLPIALSGLLDVIDGASDGWTIRERLATAGNQRVDAGSLARNLGRLRREGIVTLQACQRVSVLT